MCCFFCANISVLRFFAKRIPELFEVFGQKKRLSKKAASELYRIDLKR